MKELPTGERLNLLVYWFLDVAWNLVAGTDSLSG